MLCKTHREFGIRWLGSNRHENVWTDHTERRDHRPAVRPAVWQSDRIAETHTGPQPQFARDVLVGNCRNDLAAPTIDACWLLPHW